MLDVARSSQEDFVRDFDSPVDNEPQPLMSLRGWIILVLILIALGSVFQIHALLVLSAFLLVLAFVSWAWNRSALHGVTYERSLSETHAFFGEVVTVTVRLANRKPLPLSWLLTYDLWPRHLPLLAGGRLFVHDTRSLLINSFSVQWNESVTRTYTLLCNRRGIYDFGPLRVKTGDLFGLFRRSGGHQHLDRLIVYPRILPLEQPGLPPRDLFGESRARLKIFEDPSRTVGIREHLPGDGLRHVHWKATARIQRMQAKVYEPTTAHTIVLVLNVSTTEEYWRGADPDQLEHAITVTASIANHVAGQKLGLGLLVNGTLPYSDQSLRVLPGRSPYQLMRVLEALAAVTPFATRSIQDMLLAESPRLPMGATLVVVSAVVSEELLVTLARLRQAGRRLVLIALTGDRGFALEGIPAYRVSQDSWLGDPDQQVPASATGLVLHSMSQAHGDHDEMSL